MSAWASLLGIIAFPTIVITTILGYVQIRDHFKQPDLILEFSNPDSLSFTIENTKDVLAEQPLYWFAIVDIDEKTPTPVPEPARELSYIRGLDKKGPTSFGYGYLKAGHRYFGFAGINCKNCEKTRRYWLYFIHGNKSDAWYREMEKNEKQGITINFKELAHNPTNYFDNIFPDKTRFPIE